MISIRYLSLTHRAWKIQHGWKIRVSYTQTASVSLLLLRALPNNQANLPKPQRASELPLRIEWAATEHLPQVQSPDLGEEKQEQQLKCDSRQPQTLLWHRSSDIPFTWCQASLSRVEKHILKKKPSQQLLNECFLKPFQTHLHFPEIWLHIKTLQKPEAIHCSEQNKDR